MNPVLADIYSTVIPSAPYIIAAYVIVLAALFIYLLIVVRGLRRDEARMDLLEQQLDRIENEPSNDISH